MPANEVTQYQTMIAPRLVQALGGVEVLPEWRTMAGQARLYSPRLDLAVGPFAVGDEIYTERFNHMAEQYANFLHLMYELSIGNFQKYGTNQKIPPFEEVIYRNGNSRCFIAVEIENRVSRKHLMGGAINAAALGRIGIAVGWTDPMVRAFVKLRAYLLYLASVGKNTFEPFNLLVLNKDQFIQAIEKYE